MQNQVFRGDTQLVRIYATVQGADGRLVPDLPREAFQVFEDRRPVDITAFASDPQAINVAVMLNAGHTASLPFVGDPGRAAASAEHLRDATLAFVRGLGPEDRARLGTFGAEIAVGARLTNGVAEFERVLREEYWPVVGAGTPLWQAISAAIGSLSAESGRRAVLVFTAHTGRDTGSLPGWRGDRASVERQLIELDGLLYVIQLFPQSRPVELDDAVAALAVATGGGYYRVEAGADLKAAFAHVAEELRHQYLLGFPPGFHDGRMHRIEVRTTQPGLTVRARTSYLAVRR